MSVVSVVSDSEILVIITTPDGEVTARIIMEWNKIMESWWVGKGFEVRSRNIM